MREKLHPISFYVGITRNKKKKENYSVTKHGSKLCFPNFLSNYLPIPCINGKQKQKIIRTISLFPVNRKFTGSTNNHLFLLQEKYVREKDRKLTEKVPPEHQPSTNRHEKEEKDRK